MVNQLTKTVVQSRYTDPDQQQILLSTLTDLFKEHATITTPGETDAFETGKLSIFINTNDEELSSIIIELYPQYLGDNFVLKTLSVFDVDLTDDQGILLENFEDILKSYFGSSTKIEVADPTPVQEDRSRSLSAKEAARLGFRLPNSRNTN